MINLKAFADTDVLIQFKTGVYVVAMAQGRLMPVRDGDAQHPGPPMVTDRMEGHLREQDGSWILTFPNPLDPTQQIDYLLDEENVSGLWVKRRIQIIAPGVSPAP